MPRFMCGCQDNQLTEDKNYRCKDHSRRHKDTNVHRIRHEWAPSINRFKRMVQDAEAAGDIDARNDAADELEDLEVRQQADIDIARYEWDRYWGHYGAHMN